MYKVDVKTAAGEVKTLDFSTQADRDSFLNGETAYDAKEYWVSLDNAEVIEVWDDCSGEKYI